MSTNKKQKMCGSQIDKTIRKKKKKRYVLLENFQTCESQIDKTIRKEKKKRYVLLEKLQTNDIQTMKHNKRTKKNKVKPDGRVKKQKENKNELNNGDLNKLSSILKNQISKGQNKNVNENDLSALNSMKKENSIENLIETRDELLEIFQGMARTE